MMLTITTNSFENDVLHADKQIGRASCRERV